MYDMCVLGMHQQSISKNDDQSKSITLYVMHVCNIHLNAGPATANTH